MRTIKFKLYLQHEDTGYIQYVIFDYAQIFSGEAKQALNNDNGFKRYTVIGKAQFTGLLDKTGKEIYEEDVLEFTDRWEWYKSKYWVDMQFAKTNEELQLLKDKLAAEPLERRKVEMPDCYEEFSTSDLSSCWEVIGNVWENPELLNPSDSMGLE